MRSSPCRVTRTRASKLSDALARAALSAAVAGAIGCGGTGPAVAVAPSQSAEPPPRRPDGVVVEPPSALPTPALRADARGVVALREPLSTDAVRDVVFAVVGAWQRESIDDLMALLTGDAGPMDQRSRGRAALQEAWRQRMRAHEYRRLEGIELVRPERIEHFEWQELGVPGAPPRPPQMQPDEVYVRVPLEVTEIAGERFFDGVLLLVLRRDEGRYRIAAYGESP
jgi:hypothetical protein